jgi:hypothetical protein
MPLTLFFIEQLPAEQAIRRGVAIVDAVKGREAEPPIEVIVLHGVGQPFDIDHGLIELDGVGRVVICGRRVAARSHLVGADIAPRRDPAVDLDMGIVHRVPKRRVAERDHQRTVDRIRPGHTNRLRAAIGPFGKRHRRC